MDRPRPADDSFPVWAFAYNRRRGLPDGLIPEERLELDDLDDTARRRCPCTSTSTSSCARSGFGYDFVAPATSSFHGYTLMSGWSRSGVADRSIEALHRAEREHRYEDDRWHLEGGCTFVAAGYTLEVCRSPLLGRRVLRLPSAAASASTTIPTRRPGPHAVRERPSWTSNSRERKLDANQQLPTSATRNWPDRRRLGAGVGSGASVRGQTYP